MFALFPLVHDAFKCLLHQPGLDMTGLCLTDSWTFHQTATTDCPGI